MGSALVANVFSYLFHFTLSRKLGPNAYGTLATLIAFAAMVGVIGASLGTVAMQETARMWSSRREQDIASFLRQHGWTVGALAAALIIGLGILSAPLSSYLQVSPESLWWLLALYAGISLFGNFGRGAAQGAHRFTLFAGSLIAEGASKVGLALSLVVMGLGLAGAVVGLVGSAVLSTAIVYVPLALGGSHLPSNGDKTIDLGRRATKILAVAATTSGLLYADMLFAKHHFAAAQAGFFGAAGTVARVIPYGAALAMPLLAPLAAAAKHATRASLGRILLLVALNVASFIAVSLAVIFPFGSWLIHLTYGPMFAPSVAMLRLYAVDESLLAAVLVAVTYLVAIGDYSVLKYVLAILILEAAGMAVFGTTPSRLLGVAISLNGLLVPIVWVLALRSLRDVTGDSTHGFDKGAGEASQNIAQEWLP